MQKFRDGKKISELIQWFTTEQLTEPEKEVIEELTNIG